MDPLAAEFRLEGTNGEAVVLIHGFTGVPSHFRPLAHELNEAGWTVNVPRLAGHGTSMEDLATTGPEDWIESARRAVAEVSDHSRIHVAGLSMGGLISLILADEVGAATVATIDSPIIVRDKTFYLAPVARYFMEKVTWDEEAVPDLDEEVQPYWLTYPGFYMTNAVGLMSIMTRGVLAARSLDIPSLVVQSLADETVSPSSARILARMLGRGNRLVWLEDSLHVAVLDNERDTIADAYYELISSS